EAVQAPGLQETIFSVCLGPHEFICPGGPYLPVEPVVIRHQGASAGDYENHERQPEAVVVPEGDEGEGGEEEHGESNEGGVAHFAGAGGADEDAVELEGGDGEEDVEGGPGEVGGGGFGDWGEGGQGPDDLGAEEVDAGGEDGGG